MEKKNKTTSFVEDMFVGHCLSKPLLREASDHVGLNGETNSGGYAPMQFLGPAEKGT